MDDVASSKSESSPPEPRARVHQLRHAFEAAWNQGQTPQIESFLADVPDAVRSALFAELLRIDVTQRRRVRQNPTLQDYQARFPGRVAVIEAFFLNTPTESFPGPMSLPSTASADADSAGLGRWPEVPGYEIVAKLPPGGMGVVYRASQRGLNRTVALKMIRSGVDADALERARFRVEAEAVAALSHPHVIQIYDYGEWNGRPYIAMEFADGGSLAQRLQREPLSPRQAAELVKTLADALEFVHAHGIIHRDLKPANVLLTDHGVPKLADFGLAKRLDQDDGLTRSQAVLGTASYMAPEQAGGERHALGPATDVYALGAILYELLTGRPPFRAETRELTIHQVLSEDPVPPTRVRPGVPAELEAICLKCLERDPVRRFASAAAVAEDLLRFLNEEAISIPSFGTFDRHARAARRQGYEILESQGSGGLGVVYKARQLALNRTVALEMINAPGDPAWVERWRSEAETVAQLHHANIAELYDFGALSGEPFMAREYVDAGSLAERLAEPPLAAEDVAALTETLARAIQQAHAHGVSHGALKPSKVRFAADGSLKITRFGLTEAARAARPSPPPDSGYSAPERTTAEQMLPAADIYSLGAILYALLTGRPPPRDPDGRVAGPRLLRPEVPRELDAICVKCLQPDPGERYPNAASLAEDLRRCRAGEVLFIDDLDEWSLQQRWARRAGYEIVELLGQKEDGFTYKARWVTFDRVVVLKRLAARHRFAPPAKERFRWEARLLARLRHPHVVRLCDHGEQNDLPYYVREFVDGTGLAEVAAKWPSVLQEPGRYFRRALKLVQRLTGAVEAIQGAGHVHGALHPGNIYVTSANVPKIAGFRRLRLDGDADAEAVRHVGYVAPEQLEGRRGPLAPACDVYALGAIAYTLFTGQPPFVCSTLPETVKQIRTQEPVSPRVRQPAIPEALAAICVGCLKKRPEERPESVARLAELLRAAVPALDQR